jgi:phosphoglycerate kinase
MPRIKQLPANACPADGMILDAGAQTIARITASFSTAKTLIWNGPLGAFELEPFDTATNAAACEAANLTKAENLVSIAGGGDTVAALNKADACKRFQLSIHRWWRISGMDGRQNLTWSGSA